MNEERGHSSRTGKQYSLHKAAGERGVLYVRTVCANVGPIAIFREQDQYHDIGIDAEIELLDRDRTTKGALAYVQVKSAEDPLKRNGAYSFTADTSNFVSWARYPFLIIGIVYSQQADRAMWVDLSGYIKDHPEIVATEQNSITVDACMPFDEAHFGEFVDYVLEWYRFLFLDKSVEEYYCLESHGKAAHLNILFAYFKDYRLFNIFLRHVFWESIEDLGLLAICLRCMSYYSTETSRPDLRSVAFAVFSSITYSEVLALLSARLVMTKKQSFWYDPYSEAAEFINEGLDLVPDLEALLERMYSDINANLWARLRTGLFLKLDPEDGDFRDLVIEALHVRDASGDEPNGLAFRVARLVLSMTGEIERATYFLQEILDDDEIDIDIRRNAAGALSELGGSRDDNLYYELNSSIDDDEMWAEMQRLIGRND